MVIILNHKKSSIDIKFACDILISDLHPDQDDIWALGSPPIKTSELAVLLSEYPLKQTADYLLNGFTHDLKINKQLLLLHKPLKLNS
jgi:hypothetical protein